jgi:medium-chain acyl-[acyl-carrier-protein] hydrolase
MTANQDPNRSSWVLCWKNNVQPKVRLFCFPFAGGGAFYYKPWAEILAPDIEICAIQLPGRENRLREQPFTSMEQLLPILVQVLEPLMDIPFAFFGHSMGAIIAFELALYLRRHNKAAPIHLFVSATAAPHLPNHRPLMHLMSDQELLAELTRLGGTPKEVLEDKDMVAMMLPLMRADVSLFETRAYTPDAPLTCPITVFGSMEDNRTNSDELALWQQQTQADFDMHSFSGGHFFLKINEHRNSMLKTISRVVMTSH